MAKVVVASVGYLGDVAPFVEPANRLADRGHDVTFLTSAGFHDVLRGERFSLATYPLDFSALAMRGDATHQRLMRRPFANQVRLGRYWMRAAYLDEPTAARQGLLDALRGADVVVSHPTFASVVVPAAEHAGVPVVIGHLFPMMIPTRGCSPPMGKRSRNLGAPANRLVWRAFAWASGQVLYDRRLNAMRRSFGLAPVQSVALKSWMSAARTVILVSRHYYAEAASDWPPVTWGGFSPWSGPPARPADPAVDAFIEAGDPPVLVTLGTSAAASADRAFETMANGLERLGLRPLLLVGDERNLASLGDRAGAFDFVPLARVLPRCRMAVVSGAVGSLAAALSAGLPVVVVPQLFDQVWHGGRVEDLGVGLMAWRLRNVADAVARIEADPTFRDRAQQLAAKLAGEDGAKAIVEAVESVL